MTTAKPGSPLDIETIAAAMLENGMVLPRRTPGGGMATAVFKTIEHTQPITSKTKNMIKVTYEDGTTNTWPPDTQVVALAESLPAHYWRAKFARLRTHLETLAHSWQHTAIKMGQPEPTSAESPAIRDGRARQARICANTITALIARPGSVVR